MWQIINFASSYCAYIYFWNYNIISRWNLRTYIACGVRMKNWYCASRVELILYNSRFSFHFHARLSPLIFEIHKKHSGALFASFIEREKTEGSWKLRDMNTAMQMKSNISNNETPDARKNLQEIYIRPTVLRKLSTVKIPTDCPYFI